MTLIDIIIPVYKGSRETRRCIDSVLASRSQAPADILVVDDASPDPEIVNYLDALAAQRRVTLLRNERNLGFVRSVNRAMSVHLDRDVVLLNSDTEGANDWLDRLRSSAYHEPDIGTVTPFSNNATICSYPFEGWNGGTPGTLGLAALDRLFATVNAGRTVDLPTAVGCCMYVRRVCLDGVGLFDAERFGRGYGEETDFCMRAAKAGWRNVLAGDVFVFHEGAVSFSDERSALAEIATKTMLDLHPHYLQTVEGFIVRDPARALRDAVDAKRLACGIDEARHVLRERIEERSLVMARLSAGGASGDERESVIAELHRRVARAEMVVSECERANSALRSAPPRAESLLGEGRRERRRGGGSWLRNCMNAIAQIGSRTASGLTSRTHRWSSKKKARR